MINSIAPNYVNNYEGQEKCPECIAHHFIEKLLSHYCARYRETVSFHGHCDKYED